MAVPIFRYPLDETGENPNNRVNNEPHDLIPKQRPTDVRVFSPKYGPFYANPLMEIRDMADGRILVKDVDFQVNDLLQDPTLLFAQQIGQSIVIINGSVSNRVSISYQVLGGNYQNDSTAIAQAWATFMNDSRPVDWDNISNKPATFPPSLHIHMLEDVIGWGPMIVALNNIEQAILLSCTPMVEALIDWMKDRPVKWSSIYERPDTLAGYGIVDGVNHLRKINTPAAGGLAGGGDLRNDLDLSIANTGVVAGTYGSARKMVTYTVNAKGQITGTNELTPSVSWGELLDRPEWLNQYSAKADARIVFSNFADIYFERGNRSMAIGGNGANYVQSGTPGVYVGDPGVLNLYAPAGIHQTSAGYRWNITGSPVSTMDLTLNKLVLNGSIRLDGREEGLAYNERTVQFPGGMYIYGNNDTPGARVGLHNGGVTQQTAHSIFMDNTGRVFWSGVANGNGAGITNIDWNNIVNKPNVDSATKVMTYNGGSWGYTRMWTDGWDPGGGAHPKLFLQWVNGGPVDDESLTSVNWPVTFTDIFTVWVSTDSKGPNPIIADYVFQTRGWDVYRAVLFAQGTYGGGRGAVTPWVFGLGIL